VGKRSAALPPGLRVGFTAGMLDRSPTGSGEVIVAGNGGAVAGTCGAVAELGGAVAELGGAVAELGRGAVIETAADAVGSFAR